MSAAAPPCDVAVIGGGLAGAAAAARLAQNGVQVTLLERETQPHHKVCGEFISHEAGHYLEKLGIDLTALCAVPVDRFKLTYGQKSVVTPLAFKAMSLSRYCLDERVLEMAENRGADIRKGVTVTSMAQDNGGWRIACQERDPVSARAVFLATGKHDLRGWSHRTGRQNDYIGFKMHYRLPPERQAVRDRTVEIILYRGGYAGWESIEDSQANLCLVVSKNTYAACGKSWAGLLRSIAAKTALGASLADATPCWDKPLAIFGIPYGFVYRPSPRAPDALFRLGDQMAVIPSLCGDGMAIALHTGFLAADCYMNADAGAYHNRANRQLAPQIGYASGMARALSSPVLQPLAIPLSRLMPGLVARAVERTRLRDIIAA